ncbi:MAG TPA: hypothetical protein V6D15_00175 [Oculatellaceae cyanobacterium]|jgi:hypothetical protein
MSIYNANRLKVTFSLITLTSFAALTPTADACLPGGATQNILNRASLDTQTRKLQQQGSPLSPSAVEQIHDVSQIRGSQTICDGSSLQGVPASKTRQGNEVLTNSTIERNTQLIRSIRFLSQ